MLVREKNALHSWLKYFFLKVAQTAEEAVGTLSKILTLKNDFEAQILLEMTGHSRNQIFMFSLYVSLFK